ncbi:tigger transposable element-derived protein 1-like [Macrobrachium nipponense]|uniref:tigger transposable element-derived protein 1-like n=1 Tax=Macrobrachium nipponense TaxID=159736 RepID=UPI0030C89B7A
MAPKRKSDSSECNSAKKARKALSLETKMGVIKKYEGGMKVNCISRSLHLSHSTVSTILKDKERIKDAVKGAAPIKSTIITKQREGPIAEMEKLLFTRLEDNRQRNVQVMLRAVQSKATSLFKMLKEKESDKGIPFKILLVLDNAPGHPTHLDDLHPNVRVVFLPPNTTPLIQPMDQGAISTFKAHYLRISFDQAIEAVDENPELTLRDYWKSYKIYHCIKHVAKAWDLVTEKCMNGIWKHCCKRFLGDFVGFDNEEELSNVLGKIVSLAKQLEFGCDEEEI